MALSFGGCPSFFHAQVGIEHANSKRAAERAGRIRAEQALRHLQLGPQAPHQFVPSAAAQLPTDDDRDPLPAPEAIGAVAAGSAAMAPDRADGTADASTSARACARGPGSLQHFRFPFAPIGFAVSCFSQRCVLDEAGRAEAGMACTASLCCCALNLAIVVLRQVGSIRGVWNWLVDGWWQS